MKYNLLVWCLLAILQLHAQVLPSEKLFFMSDQMSYEQGDTAWIEGRVIRSDNDTTFVPYSRYVYVELADERDTVLVRQKLVCDSIGNFITRMPIDYWLPGYYYMRAYSKVMANFAPETLPIFPIRIGEDMEPGILPSDLACSFYPEGGHLVNGCISPRPKPKPLYRSRFPEPCSWTPDGTWEWKKWSPRALSMSRPWGCPTCTSERLPPR